MAGLTNSAIIVIVLVACLAVTALGASLFKHYKPADGETPFSPGYEQKLYMAEVRARGFEDLQQACWGRDLESRCKLFILSPMIASLIVDQMYDTRATTIAPTSRPKTLPTLQAPEGTLLSLHPITKMQF